MMSDVNEERGRGMGDVNKVKKKRGVGEWGRVLGIE